MKDIELDQVTASTIKDAGAIRPRFLRDLVLVPFDTGVLIDGMGRQEVIRGPLAQTVLPDLVAFLDGTHTMSELETEFPSVPPEYLQSAVSTLMEWGMIEHNADERDPITGNPDALAFFRRHIAVSRYDQSALQIYDRLRDAKVIVVGPDGLSDLGDHLRLLLETSGIGSSEVVSPEEMYAASIGAETLVVALSQAGADGQWYEELEKRNVQYLWLRATIDKDATYADIGPLFKPGNDSCYACFHCVHSAAPGGNTLSHSDKRYLYDLWLGFVALETINILAMPALALNGRRFRRSLLPAWEARELCYPRLPGCQRCRKEALYPGKQFGNGADGNEHFTDTALVFEDYVGLESRISRIPNVEDEFARIGRVHGQETKAFPSCRQVPLYRGTLVMGLDVFEAIRTESRANGSRLTIDQLAPLFAFTAGARQMSESGIRRWAANAGNLGSVELFVVNRYIDGLDQGFYFYQAQEHSLACFRKRASLEVCEFMSRVLRRSENQLPDALILFTGAFHRLSRKYRSFAYRLMHLDTGAALSQFHLVARSMNIYARTLSSQADDLIQDQLNLQTLEEVPTAVVEILCRPNRQEKTKPPVPNLAHSLSLKPAREFANMDLQEVTAMVIRESLRTESEPPSNRQTVPMELLHEPVPFSSVIRLPKPAHKGLSVGEVLAKRRSVRKFRQTPIELGSIGAALQNAYSSDEAGLSSDSHCLTYFVLANNVHGIDCGVYIYEPNSHALLKVRQPLSSDETASLLVQSEFADAPAIIWIAGNLAASCALEGARGHCQLLGRAGVAGHRLWMTAIGLGLCGCLIAGLIPGAARRLLGMDGYKIASLFAFAVGYQADGLQSQINPEGMFSK